MSLLSCEKPQEYTISYKYIQTSGSLVETTTEYTIQNQTTKIDGPIKTQFWVSEEIPEMQEGQQLFFTLNAQKGTGTFVMQILRDGGILEQDTISLSFTEHTLTAFL